mgnify:CR=1 FL=1
MYDDNLLAGRGLRLMFISQLLALIGGLMGESVLAGLLSLVAIIMGIGALNVAAPSHPYFGRAFWLNIVRLVLTGLTIFSGAYELTVLVIVFSIASLALEAYIVYLVCTAAGQILTVNGYATLAYKGAVVWKIHLCCTVALACFTVMALVPLLLILAGVLVIGTAIAALVGSILYLKFLSNAYHILLGAENF